VEEIVSLIRPSMPGNITLEFELSEDLPEIYTDPGQLERVLINLITNSRDAMSEGGRIVFTTKRVRGEEAPANERNEGEDYLCLSVTDTGCGMDEETVQRIFEPFFTTKPRGKGTGLGMPVVYGLMQSHNGLVDVRSKPGVGTSISLFFPVPTQPPARKVEAPESPSSLEGTETVLVVDDEPDVLQFLTAILELHGYEVLSARSGEAALEMLSSSSQEVHVLLSDVGLSGIDGFELARRLRERLPGLRAILCSGCTDALLEARLAEAHIEGFVAKPYDTQNLLRTIRLVIEAEVTA
jgi:CheY-like chemotaxis protein